MKRFVYPSLVILVIILLQAFKKTTQTQNELTGAWHIEQGSADQVMIFQDGYYTQTAFDKDNKLFIGSVGGVYKELQASFETKIEFSSRDKNNVGAKRVFPFVVNGEELTIEMGKHNVKMTKIDNGNGNLAGIWRITGRMQNGEVVQMQRGDRKTLKILSGTRFQWMAINPVTKEFSGTGGGTYTFKDGKYTETIEFFSRDSSRVGASLTFDGSVKDDVWNHSGLSSKGDPINELWTREKY